MNLLADMLEEILGLPVHLGDEVPRLGVNEGGETLHVLPTADELEDHAAVFAEGVAVGEQREGTVPANKLATDGNDGPGGVDGALLLEHVDSVLGRVQDYIGLSQHGNRYDTA